MQRAVGWWVLVVALVVGSARPVWADEHAGARFTVPAEWTVAEQSGMRVLAPAKLAKGELMMAVVLGAESASGAPAAQLDAVASVMNQDAKVVWTSDTSTTDRGAAGKLYIRNYDVDTKELGLHVRMLVILVRGNQRVVMTILISNEATMKKYGAGMQSLLKSLELGTLPAASTPKPSTVEKATGKLPTGDTPDLYPGSAGWLPSGRGVKVPAGRVVKGRPEGIWWYPQVRGNTTVALRVIYLADGTCATYPRPGGSDLFDVEQQRKLGGVGTCEVKGGTFTRVIDGHTQTSKFSSGSDDEGAYFNLGAMRHRPLAPVSASFLIGTWRAPGNTYTFREDGTYSMGGQAGTWQVDGYLIAMRPDGQPGWISTIGSTGKPVIVINSSVYTRQ